MSSGPVREQFGYSKTKTSEATLASAHGGYCVSRSLTFQIKRPFGEQFLDCVFARRDVLIDGHLRQHLHRLPVGFNAIGKRVAGNPHLQLDGQRILLGLCGGPVKVAVIRPLRFGQRIKQIRRQLRIFFQQVVAHDDGVIDWIDSGLAV